MKMLVSNDDMFVKPRPATSEQAAQAAAVPPTAAQAARRQTVAAASTIHAVSITRVADTVGVVARTN